MTTSKKYLLALSVVILLLAMLSGFSSKTYEVHTEMELNAPPIFIFNALNDLNHQSAWNTKATLDTTFKLTCVGNTVGAGVSCDYSSTLYGNGVLRILSNLAEDSIVLSDEQQSGKEKIFIYKLLAKDSVTTMVHVSGSGKSGFITNLWNFIHRWKLKKHIHQNLDNLKVFVNNRYKNKMYNGFQIKEMLMNQKFFISYRSQVEFDNIQQYYTQNISGLYQKALEQKLSISGMPCGLYYDWDEKNGKADMAAALPTLAEFNIMDVESVNIPSKSAIMTEYKGESSKSAIAHVAMDEYMLDHRLEKESPVIEEYLTDPAKEPDPAQWVTNIIYYIVPKK
jgi:effector-binding domain-containing protein